MRRHHLARLRRTATHRIAGTRFHHPGWPSELPAAMSAYVARGLR